MELFVFSSTRALKESFLNNNSSFLPDSKTIQEFLNDIIIVPNKAKIPKDFRKIILWDIINNMKPVELKFAKTFLHFLENSNFIFGFFDELYSSIVDIKNIDRHDIYGSYEDHLNIIGEIFSKYNQKLDSLNLYDCENMSEIVLNTAYLKHYKQITIKLDGILSKRDFTLLKRASEHCNITIKFLCDKYNIDIFKQVFNKHLKPNFSYVFTLNNDELIESSIENKPNKIHQFSFNFRINQALLVIAKVNEWLESGIKNIAVILPDEEFARYLELFDTKRNLNYAMGEKNLALRQKIKNLQCEDSNASKIERVLLALKKENINLGCESSLKSFEDFFQKLEISDILEFLIANLINQNDTSGGKVTVMGILETRGLSFEKVIIVDFNEDFIPTLSDNDIFLNTSIRKNSGIPTLMDKENLQRHYYNHIFTHSNEIFVAFCEDSPKSTMLDSEITPQDGDKIWRFFDNELDKNFIDETFSAQKINMRLSATSIKTFDICELQFYFKYICNLSEENDDSKPLGGIIHDILNNLGKDFNTKKLDNLINKIMPLSQRLDAKIAIIKLSSFLKSQKDIEILELEAEKEFEFMGFAFTCRIDRIDKIGSKIRVIDYKYKKNFKIKDEGYMQLFIYKQALKRDYGDNIECLYLDLNNNKEYIMTKEHESECEARLVEILSRFNNKITFNKTDKKTDCKYCAFKHLCDRF